jgi:putative aminopeptidase FrvX
MENNNIPYQLEIVTGDGLTNNEIMYLANGILTANINLPVRYKNTLNECVCEEDILNLIKTLKLILV